MSTGDQAALFDAPRHPGQGYLFGELYQAPLELEDQAAEIETTPTQRILNQRDVAAARHADVIAHRRECGNCIPGHLCREGKKLEKELRIALDVLHMVQTGEL